MTGHASTDPMGGPDYDVRFVPCRCARCEAGETTDHPSLKVCWCGLPNFEHASRAEQLVLLPGLYPGHFFGRHYDPLASVIA